jgi:hypothetical protein
MATLAAPHIAPTRDDNFFLKMALVMSFIIIAGFSLQLAAGRSSFRSPPLVHAHAIVFMGWWVIYLLQNIFVTRGTMALHRTLGWIAAGWTVLMVVLGCAVTVAMVRAGHVPFFFRPLQFLIFDPMTVFAFAGLTAWAIAMRRRTEWHRRLHYCGMSLLLGPAFGRLLPVPFLAPWAYEATYVAVMVFPVIGMIADRRRTGSVHPAWGRGIAVMIGSLIVTEAVTYTPAGTAIYGAVTAGSPGAAVPPLDFPPPPPGFQVTGR